jgi:predicted nucleic acid-binding protein
LILLDTNVLVYALNSDARRHADCHRVVEAAVAGTLPGVLVPQVLIECYSVITSPRRVARPVDPSTAMAAVRALTGAIAVRAAPATMLEDLEAIVAQHPRRGQDVFDLVLVAQMVAHGIRAICTCNARHFDVDGIRAVDPAEALAVYA